MSEKRAIKQNYGGRWVEDFTKFIKEICDGEGSTLEEIEQNAFISLGVLPTKTDDLVSQLISCRILKKEKGNNRIKWIFGEIPTREMVDGEKELEQSRPKYKGK